MNFKFAKGRILKQITSFIMVFLMIFGMMPWQEMKAYAFDADRYYVDNITITKIYEKGGYAVKQTKLTIQGSYLQGATVGTMTSTGYKKLENANPNTDNVLEFVVEGDIIGGTVNIGNISVAIDQNQIPAISNIDKRNVKAGTDGIIITGSNLENIGKTISGKTYTAYYENITGAGGTNPLTDFKSQETSKIETKSLSGTPGFQSIVIQKQETVQKNFNNNNSNKKPTGENDIKITIQNTYVEQFRLINEITVNGLDMNPNRGQAGDGSTLGDEVIFTAQNGLDRYDVFFLKNLKDKFTNENKGVNTEFNSNVDGKQVLVTHVPNKKPGVIENGEYYVVITNRIPDGKNPNEEITKQYIVSDKFTVIDAGQKMKIISIKPAEGPDTGSKAELSGLFFGTLNIAELQMNDNNKVVGNPTTPDQIMNVTYSGGKYKNQNVTSVDRVVKVIVGDYAKFVRKKVDPNNSSSAEIYEYKFTDALDTISINTPQVSDAEKDPLKDVVVETTTTIKIAAHDGQPEQTVVIKDRAEIKDGYNYKPSKLTPKVVSITPEKIQVKKNSDSNYTIDEDRLIAIDGENFLIHKYIKSDGSEEIRYPVIELGNEIRLNKNSNGDNPNPTLYLKVFDKQGKELDGSVGNEIGSKILVKIPKGTKITLPGKTHIKVINPIRNTDTEGLSDKKPDAVEFIMADDKPVIENVSPNVVTVNGGEDITIIGSNFKDGVKIFIDGAEVQSIKREGDGKKITFKAPKGREGQTQLQVMNPSGAIAITDFTYVKTYTDPKITSFSPNKGSHGTLVFVKGDNFLKPDPTTTDISGANVYKIIGSRILLDGKDINKYNKDANNKVELKAFSSETNKSLIKMENKLVKLDTNYQSVIFEDAAKANSFYTLDINAKGEATLSNGQNETYTIVDQDGTDFKAISYTGTTNYIAINNATIEIKDDKKAVLRTLNIKTPYIIEKDSVSGQDVITGNKVKIINKNELLFTVPILDVEKWYDLTVQNPDTKKDSRLGEQGFYYFKTPKKNPSIDKLDPPQGSTEGGYSVDIYGKDFEANGDIKSRVFIGGVEVPSKDVIISTDKTKITIMMPKYPGNLKTEIETDRKTVPVVITNSDGGNAKKEDGFTYVIPTSNPKITKILPNNGSAAGGEVIQIWGTDFRYFEPYTDSNGNAQHDSTEKFIDLNGNDKWDNMENESEYKALKEAYDKLPVNTPADEKAKKDYRNILPKIYFGKKTAEVVDFSDGYISVKTPVGQNGNVDVYVLNNDFGTSNKVPFTYKVSSPQINKIIPNTGRKQGQDKIEILGKEFSQSNVDIVKSLNPTKIETTKSEDNFVLIRFGDMSDKNMSNTSIPAGEYNAGTIIGTVGSTIVGNLTVKYDANDSTNKKLKLSAKNKELEYTATIDNYKDGEIYIPLNLLTNNTSGIITSYPGYELVKISIDTYARRVLVERGYSPATKLISSEQIELSTPSYYTVGKTPVTIINPDKGEAKGEFEYKNPDSHPAITELTRDGEGTKTETINGKDVKVIKINYKGGSNIGVIGSDFRENAKISIGDILEIPYKDITPTLPDKLTFKMPAVDYEKVKGKLFKVVVTNEDGGAANSDDSKLPLSLYIMFTKGETEPKIEKLTPNSGPSTGGTKVKIEGVDFRNNLEGFDKKLGIYFGDVKIPDDKIQFVDYKTIYVTTTSHAPGKVDVKLENPDGEMTILKDAFTFLSNPKITSVVSPTDDKISITEISVDGGESVKIKGADFMEGSRVVFAPVLEEVKGDNPTGDIITINGTNYILKSGTDAAEVKFIDTNTLTVKTPAGKLDTKGVIVINPDKSATNIYQGIKYVVSQLPAPKGVEAVLMYDKYIKISWNKVDDAKEYEIYAIEDNKEMQLIGSTQLTSFVYNDLKSNTDYTFIVKAIGQYGLSKGSEKSNKVSTGRNVGPTNPDGNLNENTSSAKTGDTANVTIGTKDYADKDIVIDLTRGSLAGSKEVVISIPASVVASYYSKNIIVVGSDFNLKFNPSAFNIAKVEQNKSKSDAGVKFRIAPYNEKVGNSLSNEYVMYANAFVGQDKTNIDYLKSKIELTLDYDVNKANTRRYNSVYLYRYDEYSNNWVFMKDRIDSYSSAITGTLERLGRYSIMGSRR